MSNFVRIDRPTMSENVVDNYSQKANFPLKGVSHWERP